MVLLTVLLINPYLTRKEKSFPVMAGATTLASFLILLTIVSGIGNYGAEGILRYSFPVFELSRKAQLPFVLLSFALLFSATWLSQVLVATGFFYYLLAEGAADPVSRRTIVPRPGYRGYRGFGGEPPPQGDPVGGEGRD
jgi:hypothetical protein